MSQNDILLIQNAHQSSVQQSAAAADQDDVIPTQDTTSDPLVDIVRLTIIYQVEAPGLFYFPLYVP